jgi:PKD repeat protein
MVVGTLKRRRIFTAMHKNITFKLTLLALVVPLLLGGCITFTTPSTVSTPATGTIPSTAASLPAIQFSVNPTSITPKGTAILSWNVTNASTVVIDQGIGQVAQSGTRAVSPDIPMIYTLTATNAAGSATGTVALSVSPGLPPNSSGGPYFKDWLGSKYTLEYHYPWCSIAQNIPQPSRIWFDTTMEAQTAGYHPCPVCNPPR